MGGKKCARVFDSKPGKKTLIGGKGKIFAFMFSFHSMFVVGRRRWLIGLLYTVTNCNNGRKLHVQLFMILMISEYLISSSRESVIDSTAVCKESCKSDTRTAMSRQPDSCDKGYFEGGEDSQDTIEGLWVWWLTYSHDACLNPFLGRVYANVTITDINSI